MQTDWPRVLFCTAQIVERAHEEESMVRNGQKNPHAALRDLHSRWTWTMRDVAACALPDVVAYLESRVSKPFGLQLVYVDMQPQISKLRAQSSQPLTPMCFPDLEVHYERAARAHPQESLREMRQVLTETHELIEARALDLDLARKFY